MNFINKVKFEIKKFIINRFKWLNPHYFNFKTDFENRKNRFFSVFSVRFSVLETEKNRFSVQFSVLETEKNRFSVQFSVSV